MERGGCAGIMIERNPGVALVWPTLKPGILDDGAGGRLFDIGKPRKVEWYCEGRPATRLEVLASIESGLPALAAAAQRDPDFEAACAELVQMMAAALKLIPAGDDRVA